MGPSKAEKVKYSEESLDTFLNSSMNVQFVIAILAGITDQMKNQLEQNQILMTLASIINTSVREESK